MDEQHLNRFRDQIPAYLAGSLSAKEREMFERAVQESETIRSEVDEGRMLSVGLAAAEGLAIGHPDSDLLATYAVDIKTLDSNERDKIERHLTDCPECRIEVQTSRESMRFLEEPAVAGRATLLQSAREWMFGSTVRWAAAAAGLVLVLAASAYWGSKLSGPSAPSVARVALSAASERAGRQSTSFVVDPDLDAYELEFLLPTRESGHYDLILQDAAGNRLQVSKDQPHQLPFLVTVSAELLKPGHYRLTVAEIADTAGVSLQAPPDTFHVEFDVLPEYR